MNKEKIKNIFKQIINYVRKYKVLIFVSIFVMVVAIAIVFVSDKLSLINYNDGSNPSIIYTEPSTMPLATTTALSNETPFALYKHENGNIVFTDGSYISASGVTVLKNGTTISSVGTIVFKNGRYITKSGIHVDKNGFASFPDGQKLHITYFTISEDGKVLAKKTDGTTIVFSKIAESAIIGVLKTEKEEKTTQPTTKPPQTTTTQDTNVDYDNYYDYESDNEDIFNNLNEEAREEFEENNQLIAQNKNDNKIWYSDDVINVLLLGLDGGSKNYPYGRSDSMIIASINKNTKSIKFVSMSRTAYVAVNGYTNTRLSHAHGYGGPALAIDTIEKNYKIKIDNYISTTFDAFKQLIDTIGGVKIELTQEEVEADAIKYSLSLQGYTNPSAGTYELNGYSALNYVRLRSIDGDRERTQRQRNLLQSIANKVNSMSITEINKLLDEILPLVTTDITAKEILTYAVSVPSYLSNDIEEYVLPHKSSSLQLIDNFEVVLVDWKNEVAYTHDLFYSDVDVKYMEN